MPESIHQPSPARLRPAPIIMGITLLVCGALGVAAHPDGFEVTTLWLWPAVLSLLATGGLVATIVHAATRPTRRRASAAVEGENLGAASPQPASDGDVGSADGGEQGADHTAIAVDPLGVSTVGDAGIHRATPDDECDAETS